MFFRKKPKPEAKAPTPAAPVKRPLPWVVIVTDGEGGAVVAGMFANEAACQDWSRHHAATKTKAGTGNHQRFRWICRQVKDPVELLGVLAP